MARQSIGLPPQTEREFQEAVLDVAKRLGYRVYHTWNSMHSTGGFPDLVLVRRPRLLFVELKSQRGRVSEQQQAWLDDLRAAGQQAFVWRPADWDTIVEVLR
jgi:hypothetical protein